MIIVARILATIFALIVVSRSMADYKNKKESPQMTIFWVIVWLVIAGIAFFPSLVETAIRVLGGNRSGLGTVFGMGLVFIMFVSYRIYIKANRVEKKLNEISRQFALLSLDKPRARTKRVSSNRPK
ncbi:MAG: DUF2304 family protein [Candidatus Berkelbacteria bacterium]|nr:DUF2304 family protein [Candidatus Berkelbacteria bacterium]